ncbi:growth arrest and DNA damage-inducible protein GADD45 alpha [Drosophila grimshawi]|uniref:GH21525 n=1 Tax=Drosophila grimshawi TaxID=7222 RepID=B4J411_DROGR|nr:growth arrest and DNA damage-inducible protein GADD45 alpha [Drosophila grimshawi]EDW01594.1 GH21525 [Drosophila grimshawi]
MVIEESVNMHHFTQQHYHNLEMELDMELAECAMPIGRIVKTALLRAQSESRVIVGLSDAINVLSKSPEGSLFCLMAEPKAGDSATHMHEVLLEAFCYENDIYVIKVDDATKLSRILGHESVESCCLVQKTWGGEQSEEQLNKAENQLVDYCEVHWDATQQPIVQLPAV